MTPPRPEQPATAAGRALLNKVTEHTPTRVLREMVLAIEQEAAATALPDVEALARALRGTSGVRYGKVTYEQQATAILAEIERGRGAGA